MKCQNKVFSMGVRHGLEVRLGEDNDSLFILQMKATIKVLKDQPLNSVEGLLNALR